MATFGTVPDDDPRRLLGGSRTRSPFAGGGGTGGPPRFSGGSEAISRGTGGGFTEALAPYNPPADLPPSPQAMWNWGTSKYQLPLGNDRLGLWGSGPAAGERPWLGEVQGPFPDPESFQRGLEGLVPGTEPTGVSFNENLGEQSVPLTPGVLRSLGIPANKVSAQVPRDIVQAGGGSIADYIAGTQPQVTQVHQPEWWESGPLGTLISFIPVIGGIQQIAKSLPKGNIGGTLAGIASILASAVGGVGVPGIGGLPGAGGPAVGGALSSAGLPALGLGAGAGGAGGFGGAANAVGEVAGGAAGLTGGGFTGAQAARGITDPAYWNNIAANAGGDIASPSYWSNAAQNLGAGVGTMPANFGEQGFWEGTPEAVGREALGIGKNLLGTTGGPSGLQGGFQGEAAGMGGGTVGGAPGGAQAGGQTGASRAAGSTGPLDMPGTMPQSPEELEQRGRAQALGRLNQGSPVGSFGRMF